ncbi:hypothetical protein DAI21_12850 [Lelliottia sp. WB101]|uniref:hypothetical protein n=1 Tax=Lelliottia sp. WB101 TaxID=2153385 RepID=UPI000D2249C0|nr:hypothetical protein [Lelliottia sp. WB101]AVY98478.1 hypothetical protein DAI21_12850 [Lelliottia sp. WB101]
MNAGFIVFIRNLLIAGSGFILISKGIKHLTEVDAAFLLMVMLVVNAQNTLYEGLFLTHTMSYKDEEAQLIYKKQCRLQYIIPILSLLFVYVYSAYILSYSISAANYILLYVCFLANILSIGTINIFCTSAKHTFYFIIDIILTLVTVIVLFNFIDFNFLIVALILRVIGSALASVIYHVKNIKHVKSDNVNESKNRYPLYSLGYFSGTLLSLCRDSISPLLIGWLIGPSALIAIRIFNTCYSAPGLIAGAMNKIVIRYAQKKQFSSNIFKYYAAVLYVMSLAYLIIWYLGGESFYELLFGMKKYFSNDSFLLALTLFCLFWPLGQTAIAKMIFLGASRLFFQVSLVWTLVSLCCIIILIKYGLAIYIFMLSLSQVINVVIIYKVSKYEATSKIS